LALKALSFEHQMPFASAVVHFKLELVPFKYVFSTVHERIDPEQIGFKVVP